MKRMAKLALVYGLAGAAVAVVLAVVLGMPSFAANGAAPQGAQLAPGLTVPTMNPWRGKRLFASKGCVVCHSINGVGGTDAPHLDASTMAPQMNPFDFFAKMWRGAVPMIAMQQNEIGHQIEFTGQDLADIVAFVHNRQVQKTFSKADIPAAIKKHLESDEDKGTEEREKGHGMMMGKPSK